MLGISLRDIHEKPKDFNAYLKKVFGKSKGPLRFTFLVMDPNSHFLELHAEEEGKPLSKLLKEIKTTIEQLKDFKNRVKDEEKVEFVRVYIYDAPAKHSLIWVDKTMHVGPYFRGQAGYKTFWIDISSGKKAYLELESDFEQLLKGVGTKELKEKENFEEVMGKVKDLIKKEEEKEQGEAKHAVG